MNLHNIVGACVAAVNPWVTGIYRESNGYTTSDDGDRVPAYKADVSVQIQMQSLVYRDLVMLDGLNLNGEKAGMYINGNWQGNARPDGRGGDLVVLPDLSVWLVVQVLENWVKTDGWTKVAVTRQNDVIVVPAPTYP